MSPGVSVAPNEAAERRSAAVAGSARIGAGNRHRRRRRHVGGPRVSRVGAAKRPRQHARHSDTARRRRRRERRRVHRRDPGRQSAADRHRRRAGLLGVGDPSPPWRGRCPRGRLGMGADRARPNAALRCRRSPSGESRDQAGTYVNLITSSSTRSLATRRSRGRGPAKNGLPRPSTMGWR
jgi:hypothetical protein